MALWEFQAPETPWGPGRRGIALSATMGEVVRAPAVGTIAFVGTVVNRPVLSIEHPGGLRTTYEPLSSEAEAGQPVAQGDVLGVVASGGVCPTECLHVGVKLNDEYVNPRLYFGASVRVFLLTPN
ncbi:M23 family metallopeptidase [Mycetocola tolaasinivorans]|uniref:M23 family metallopeptidase n=1 Tax=Mycetocola tolaasinivorans TaxID=76635 RepID=A0A3L7A4K9_9MICO|nr:M23 family metallopeptidase [Mycetocola tolaasinivorans]